MATSLIIGPTTESSNNGLVYRRRFKYKYIGHRKDRPTLPYYDERARAWGTWTMNGLLNVGSLPYINVDLVGRAYAQAYDRFHKRAFDQAQLALTIAERGKSMQMIVKRATQVARAARALKSLHFGDFARELGITSLKSKIGDKYFDPRYFRKSATKSLSDTWLEYTFGWKPLIQDIGAAVDVLQQDFKGRYVSGKGRETFHYSEANSGYRHTSDTLISVRIRGFPKVTNPNLLLAKQLGFTNPAFVAWDAIPFSFVIDWFLPVGKFLASWDNEFGYTVLRRSRGIRVDLSGMSWHTGDSMGLSDRPVSYRRFSREIPTSFPRPDFTSRIRVPELNPWLAVTSVSLAVQQLSSLLSRK